MLPPFRFALALFAGLSLWVAFPDIDLPWMAPIGIAALLAAVRGARTWVGGLLGLAAGLAWFVPYVSWTGLHVGVSPWLALAVVESLFVAVFGALAARAGGRRWEPVVVAASWSLTEWGRAAVPFGGFPWGRVAYSQAGTPLLGYASVGGPALIGFVVALLGALLLRVVTSIARRERRRAVLAPAAAIVLLLVAPMLVPRPTAGPTVTVMAVQGSAPEAGLDFNAERRQILDNHARTTTSAASRIATGQLARPDLVVWPENASDIDPFVNADAGRVIDAAVDAVGVPTLVGAVLGGGRTDLTNTTILWRPGTGASDTRYDKRELVPFGEYMPHRDFFRAITRKVDLLERDFVPGHVPGVMPVPTAGGATIHAGLAICFEVAIDHVVRDTVTHGADLLVVQTNNAMFDRSAESAQQLAISRVRAVEFGRSVIHASNVGISALVTPDGVAHQATGLFVPTVIEGAVPLRTDLTLAARLGPAPDIALAAIALLGILVPMRRPHLSRRR